MATPERAVWVDHAYDRDHASDGSSRYGAYLRDRARLFRPAGLVVNSPGEFAQLAFRIACPPIMSPGYVRTHPRVREVGWQWDDEERLAVEVTLVVPVPAVVAEPLRDWEGWHRGAGEHQRWVAPYDNDRAAALTTLSLRIPLDAALLPTPAYHGPGQWPDLDTAKTAVATTCAWINTHAQPVLAALGSAPGRDRGL